ncbi:MAG TPA: TrkH family potassium uptake protein [Chlamydiales bacterium]|nr:TrkH family potassium uptake protein [Chlamydiales bacterium]
MNFSEILRNLGSFFFYFSIILVAPLFAALYFEYFAVHTVQYPFSASLAFFQTLLITLVLSYLFTLFAKKKATLYRRESIVLLIAIWVFAVLLSSLPFIFTKTLKPLDAFFESMSGLTTTGSTLFTPKAFDISTSQEVPITLSSPDMPTIHYQYFGTIPIQAVHPALLFWRSFLQWLGGMGIVVLFLTLLPALGMGGKFLYQMESTGPVKDTIHPRIRETASLLWKLYVGLTILQMVLLLLTNSEISFFDAMTLSFSTLSTGGFSIHDTSVAFYKNPVTEWIIIAFMLLGSINFAFYFYLWQKNLKKFFTPDFFLFVFFILVGSGLSAYFLVGTPNYQVGALASTYSISDAIRAGSFQAISAQTTTGFFTANYILWPFKVQMILLILMFIGGMSGSTAGGIKTSRYYILYKVLLFRLESLFRPEAVRRLVIHGSEIDMKSANSVLSFFCLVAFFSVIGALFFTIDGIDPATSTGLIASFINNTGMGFDFAGPLNAINFLSPISKLFAIFWMLLGRLEYFVVLLLFFPSFWRGK